MEPKVIAILFAVIICSHATYLGAYTGKYGIVYPRPAAYGIPVPAVKAPIPYTLPAVGYNSIPLGGQSIYPYSSDWDNFYGNGPLGVLDPGYGAASFIDKGLYAGNLRYGYGPSLSGFRRYNLPFKK